MRRIFTGSVMLLAAACARPAVVTSPAPTEGKFAQIFYWKARPGMFDDYARYIREVAEPIDHEAQRQGAFLSVTTYETRDTASAWTHMRVFILRDSAQLTGLSAALAAAGVRLEPDSVKRRQRSEYSATLRDRGAPPAVVRIFR